MISDAPKLKRDPGIITWFIVMHGLALLGPLFFFSWGAFAVCIALYFVTGMLGITLGYHRLLTHRSFKAPQWVERFLATLGVLALQRSPLEWVGHHRMHHSFTDTGRDPHDSRKGFWWSHIGWMCYVNPEITDVAKLRKFARDIAADPYLMLLTKHWVQVGLQVALGLGLWATLGVEYMLWGIWTRCALVYHVTWFVNSATHKWGYRNYETTDASSNTWWVGILAFGEGWHNNHHAQPDVAPAGRLWFEFDLTFQVIKLMKLMGLAWDIKMPRPVAVPVERPPLRAPLGRGGAGVPDAAAMEAKAAD